MCDSKDCIDSVNTRLQNIKFYFSAKSKISVECLIYSYINCKRERKEYNLCLKWNDWLTGSANKRRGFRESPKRQRQMERERTWNESVLAMTKIFRTLVERENNLWRGIEEKNAQNNQKFWNNSDEWEYWPEIEQEFNTMTHWIPFNSWASKIECQK